MKNIYARVNREVAAGVTTEQIKKYLHKDMNAVRTMPNTPVKVRQAMTLVAKNNDEHALSIARHILGCLGKGFIMRGVTEGLSWDVASKLVCQTIRGSLNLLEASGCHPAVLKDEVTSPGGMAAAGLAALTEGGMRTVIAKGISISTRQINYPPYWRID